MKNTPADFVRLFITRRPSEITFFNTAKSESSSTSCAVCLAASLPHPIAAEQSVCRIASKSFTPSPVIATLCPRFCSAAIIKFKALNTVQILSRKICGIVFVALFIKIPPCFCLSYYYTQKNKKGW